MAYDGSSHGNTYTARRGSLDGSLAQQSYENPHRQQSHSNGTHGPVSSKKNPVPTAEHPVCSTYFPFLHFLCL